MYAQDTQSRNQVQDFGFFGKKIDESSRIEQLAEAQALVQDIENEIEEQSKCRKSS